MGEGKIEKRNRPPVSCEPCRGRKLKCNRAHPCGTCIRRGKTDICQYAPNADRSKADAKRVPVVDQLKRLEDMIAHLGKQKRSMTSIATPESSEDSARSNDGEQSQHTGTPASAPPVGYADASHWSSILDDIKDIRAQLDPSGVDYNDDNRNDYVSPDGDGRGHERVSTSPRAKHDLGFRTGKTASLQEMLQQLPSKKFCDYCVSRYFHVKFATLPIILPALFLSEYEAFWEARSKVSPRWLALLYAMLSLTVGGSPVPDAITALEDHAPTMAHLSSCTEQCLILGNYTEGGKYVMEALLLHQQSFFIRRSDGNAQIWLVSGIVLRLAIQLGYHKDPSGQRALSHLTPFECEMRRRIWLMIYQMDALISFHLGLPSMMPEGTCDTQIHQNIELSDFDPDSLEMPPSRPMSDHTTATYSIAKHPVLEMFRKIVAFTQSIQPHSYQDVLRLHDGLHNAYNSMPAILKSKPISRSLIDDTGLVMRRITIEMLYLKSLIILHRQHLAHHSNPVTAPSHRECIKAALTMLARQKELNGSTEHGGLLYNDRYLLNTLTVSDFIFASVVVCLDLTIRVSSPPCTCQATSPPQLDDPLHNIQVELTAIEDSHRIWTSLSQEIPEAGVAARALAATIRRVKEYQNDQAALIPYADMQRISFTDHMVPPPADDGFSSYTDLMHWEYIDNWMPKIDDNMQDLAAYVLNGADFDNL